MLIFDSYLTSFYKNIWKERNRISYENPPDPRPKSTQNLSPTRSKTKNIHFNTPPSKNRHKKKKLHSPVKTPIQKRKRHDVMFSPVNNTFQELIKKYENTNKRSKNNSFNNFRQSADKDNPFQGGYNS